MVAITLCGVQVDDRRRLEVRVQPSPELGAARMRALVVEQHEHARRVLLDSSFERDGKQQALGCIEEVERVPNPLSWFAFRFRGLGRKLFQNKEKGNTNLE